MPNIDRDGVSIHYEAHGDGPAIILSHGYGATSQMWAGQIDVLSADHRLIVWDMRGHGLTDSPDDPACYSEAETVADIAAGRFRTFDTADGLRDHLSAMSAEALCDPSSNDDTER